MPGQEQNASFLTGLAFNAMLGCKEYLHLFLRSLHCSMRRLPKALGLDGLESGEFERLEGCRIKDCGGVQPVPDDC